MEEEHSIFDSTRCGNGFIINCENMHSGLTHKEYLINIRFESQEKVDKMMAGLNSLEVFMKTLKKVLVVHRIKQNEESKFKPISHPDVNLDAKKTFEKTENKPIQEKLPGKEDSTKTLDKTPLVEGVKQNEKTTEKAENKPILERLPVRAKMENSVYTIWLDERFETAACTLEQELQFSCNGLSGKRRLRSVMEVLYGNVIDRGKYLI